MKLTDEQQQAFDGAFKAFVKQTYRGSGEELASLRIVVLMWYERGFEQASEQALLNLTHLLRQMEDKLRPG